MALTSSVAATSATGDRQWFIVGRWQEFEGEARANLLRTIAIGAFYVIELLNYYGLNLGWLHLDKTVEEPFHRAVTALAAAWTLVALATLLCLKQQIFPWTLKYLTTASDLVLLTAILAVGDGPRSPLVVGYFLVIALATLRLQLRLVWFSTLGAMVGYLFLLGYSKWFDKRAITVPRYHELVVLLALALTGVVLGQVIRRIRSVAEQYARRIEPQQRGNA